jgi:hypothetical protein
MFEAVAEQRGRVVSPIQRAVEANVGTPNTPAAIALVFSRKRGFHRQGVCLLDGLVGREPEAFAEDLPACTSVTSRPSAQMNRKIVRTTSCVAPSATARRSTRIG